MNLQEEIEHCKKVHDPTREALLKVLKGRDFKVGVEIGVQYGINAEMILDSGVEKLYGIDPFDTEFYPISPLRGMDEEIYQHVLERMKRFGDRYTLLRKTSNEALLDIEGEIDFIYIDGGKSRANILDDISYWYPKLRAGGIMAGNDFEHSSYPWITRFLKKHFKSIHKGEGDLWWVIKNETFNPGGISVVTPFYNTSIYAKELIDTSAGDPRIDELIIVDDCSKPEEFEKLKEIVGDNPKVKLYKNETNVGEFKTRIKGTQLARNKWVIFLDGDNSLEPEYIDSIFNIPYWRDEVIYCPDHGGNVKIDYTSLSANYLGQANIKRVLSSSKYIVSFFLGTGNYFMNKGAYLNTAIPIQDVDKFAYGDYYFNGEWLKKNMMYVVKGMTYKHRLRKNSAWMENKHQIQPLVHQTTAELLGRKQCECKYCRAKRDAG